MQPKTKRLEWSKREPDIRSFPIRSITPVGEYRIFYKDETQAKAYLPNGVLAQEEMVSLDEAKSLCQSHFDARVMACLEG